MYVGRIVAVGKAKNGRNAAMYRVSSRSFPNRTARVDGSDAWIVPRAGFEEDVYKNPYISYRCVRVVGDVAIASNGSHTDPIADKIGLGLPIRDAMASTLLTMDYEKDDYDTPRIVVAVQAGAEVGFLGIVRRDGLHVKEMPIQAGECYYLATYEIADVSPNQKETLDVQSAAEAAKYVVEYGAFADLEKPITSAAALETDGGFEVATHTVE